MPAYVFVNVNVTDPVRYEEYRKLAGPTVTAYGGRFIVRGGAAEVLEGSFEPRRIVLLEFPTAGRAKEWWSSPEYAPVMKIRHATATTDMILIEGV